MRPDADDRYPRWEKSLLRESGCPQCHGPVLPIMYGMPDGTITDVIIGGCVIGPDTPSIGCESCGWRGDPADLLVVSEDGVRPVIRSFEVLRAIAEDDDELVVTNLTETAWLTLAHHQILELREGVKAAAGLAGRTDVPTDLLVERLIERHGGTASRRGGPEWVDVVSALLRAGDVLGRGTRVVDAYSEHELAAGGFDRVHTMTIGPDVLEPNLLGIQGGPDWNEGDAERLFTAAKDETEAMVRLVVELEN